MELLKLHTNLPKSDIQSLRLMTITLVLVLIHQTFSTILFSKTVFINLVIIALGSAGCVFFLSKHTLSSYPRSFILLIFYFVIIGLLMGFGNLPIVLGQDLRYVLLFLMGGIFAYNAETMSYFHWLMKWLGVISILFGILAILFFDITSVAIAERLGTWTISYYFWWASCACFSYWGYYALFTNKHRFLGIAVLMTYVVLGALFVKRASLLNGLVILLVYFIINRKTNLKSFLRVLVIVASSVVILYALAPSVFNTITEVYSARINQTQEDLDELDRNREVHAYFESASKLQILLGNGIGHYTKYSGAINKDNITMNALHIGWANIIYKGGVLYLLFYVVILFAIIRKCFNARKLNSYQLTCLGVSISSIVSLLYEGSWTYTIDPVCISAPLFYLLSNNENEIA